jgi:16S rRNA (guanine527-N7)-methyltransferase
VSAYDRADFERDMGVSREASERLETHRRLLAEWSARMSLVGPRELDAYWSRHALDSAQLIRLAPDARRWLDLGAGAGFPGIVIACLLADKPGTQVHLIESVAKKARFLEAAIAEAALPAKVFNVRIERVEARAHAYDVVTARALAPLPRLMGYAKPFLDCGALGLFHKGAEASAELDAAKHALGAYRADVLDSISDPRGRIVRISRAG